MEYSDEALSDLAVMLFDCPEQPTPWTERLPTELLDFSIPSLSHINEYLDFVRVQQNLESDRNLICLRAGAYVGEVIRRNSPPGCWHWLDYEHARQASPELFAGFEKSIATCAVLYQRDGGFCFPLVKVCKYLENGPEDDTRFFAEVFIAQSVARPA
jgi:hypothetical protein